MQLPFYLPAPVRPMAYTAEERIAIATAAVRLKAANKLGLELSSALAYALAPLAEANVPIADVVDLVDTISDRRVSASYIGRLYREACHVA